MQNEISKPVAIVLVAVVVLVLGVASFLLLRDKAPTTAINTKGREQLGPPPAKTGPPPQWVLDKLHSH